MHLKRLSMFRQNICMSTMKLPVEMILENECECTKFNLGAKVEEYIAKATPSELFKKSMWYLVNAGNAMAHDKKDMNDNLIKLKSSDCDFMLKALETVFDEIFVKPKQVKGLDKQLAKVMPKK